MSAPDQSLQEQLDSLAERWAKLSIEEDGWELALAYFRAAYWLGYVHALEGREAEDA